MTEQIHHKQEQAAAGYGRGLAEQGIGIAVLLDEFLAIRASLIDDGEKAAQLDRALKAALEGYVERRLQQTAQEAERDAVTGLPGRAAFERALAEEIARASRYKRYFSFALLDLDDFKAVNDRFGHAAGDRLLGEVARGLRSSLRESDRLFRYGGDEFVVLSPETRVEDLALACARIAREWRATPGFSWGIAGFPDEAEDAAQLVRLADRRLYERKRGETAEYAEDAE